MVVWQSIFGRDFECIQPFLQPTPRHSRTWPCTFVPWCQCDHEVREDPEWEQVGVCTCGECEPIPLRHQDTVIYALNQRAFGDALRRALGFEVSDAAPSSAACLRPHSPFDIGLHAPLHAPVYFHAPTVSFCG